MRLTVNLDQDAYSYTSAYARARGITLSAAMNELVHRIEQLPVAEAESQRLELNEHGYFEIVESGNKLTPQMVKDLSEDGVD